MKTPPLENMWTKTGSWEEASAWMASTAGVRRACWALLVERVVKSLEELRRMMIRADGARRVYSVTYLVRARGRAFIQNAKMMVFGCGLVSLGEGRDCGSWI